jgi:hypothetical protein
MVRSACRTMESSLPPLGTKVTLPGQHGKEQLCLRPGSLADMSDKDPLSQLGLL